MFFFLSVYSKNWLRFFGQLVTNARSINVIFQKYPPMEKKTFRNFCRILELSTYFWLFLNILVIKICSSNEKKKIFMRALSSVKWPVKKTAPKLNLKTLVTYLDIPKLLTIDNAH